MNIKAFAIVALLVTGCAHASEEQQLSDQQKFEQRFAMLSKQGVALDFHKTKDGPWGEPNPDAPAELSQFAFMVGRHDCISYQTGINRYDPDKVMEVDMAWLAFYALDGRAIRDEYYAMGGNGEQTRVYDPYAKEWWVTWASVPGKVAVVPEPKPNRGKFRAFQDEHGNMIMQDDQQNADGVDFIRQITFFDITPAGFEWKSETVYPDKTTQTGRISCKRVAGPNWPMQ